MTVEMFPENEIIRLSDNVFIQKSRYSELYKVWLQVEHQYFEIGMSQDTEEEARWHAKMLCKALNKLTGNVEKI